MQIQRLDPGNRQHVDGVVELHHEHLADSPVVQFGRRFTREIYYGALVRDGLLDATVCTDGDRVVGFISYTLYPNDFLVRGMRRHLLAIGWALFREVLGRPATLRDVFHVLRVMRERSGESDEAVAGVGEVLSLIGEKAYQNKKPDGGKSRLTVRLFEEMVTYFRSADFTHVRLLVKPENKASNLFCSIMGCAFEKLSYGGIPTHRYTYALPPVETAG